MMMKPIKTTASTPSISEQNGKIEVLLVDDHRMMRIGIRKVIEAEKDLTVIAEASDGDEAVKLAHEYSPDVIIMDINMPGMNGIEATKKILSGNLQTTVIGLSLHESENVKQAMKKAGASAYLQKTKTFGLLCTTIQTECRASANFHHSSSNYFIKTF